MLGSRLKVSVCVLAYNHEQYIGQCLQSIVSQEGDFNLEVLVGCDASNDQTLHIARSYAYKYPDIIQLIEHKKNIGGNRNYISVHGRATGKYVCHVDGDDYLLLEKIKKQVEVLEENPDCIACSHDMKVLTHKKILPSFRRVRQGKKSLEDFIMQMPFFCHSSKMYRREPVDHFYNIDCETIDCEFHIRDLFKGKIYHIDESLGVYRRSVGISSLNGGDFAQPNHFLETAILRLYEYLADSVDDSLLQNAKAKKLMELAYQHGLAADANAMRERINKSVNYSRLGNKQYCLYILAYFPSWFVTKSLRFYARVRNKA